MFAPPLTNDLYATMYKLRKESSTMTSAAIAWFKDNSKNLIANSINSSDPNETFSVLSVGCGEGDIDLEIINYLSYQLGLEGRRLKYVAFEPNPHHRECFLQKLQTISFTQSTEVHVFDKYFAEVGCEEEEYNLILFIHVLYYFSSPYKAIQQALSQLKSMGKVIIVHQEETGIPQIQYQQMMQLKGDKKQLLTTENIQKLLNEKGHRYYYQTVDASLDITECLALSECGTQIMSFCMECDLRFLPDFKLDSLLQSFRDLAYFVKERAFIYEPIGVFILPFLNPFAWEDKVQDYKQIVNSFPWHNFLEKPQKLRILDIACGKGRWLQEIQRHLKLENGKITIELLDPDPIVVEQAIQNLTSFKCTQKYIMRIQDNNFKKDEYDILWSMHGFYAIPAKDLDYILPQCVECLKTNGVGFIALATQSSFYVHFHNQYLKNLFGNLALTSAEEVQTALERKNIKHEITKIIYHEKIHVKNHKAVENYIIRESSLNSFEGNTKSKLEKQHISLEVLMHNPQIALYLKSLESDFFYHFPQEVWLISFYH